MLVLSRWMVYKKKKKTEKETQHLYGSKMIGMYKENETVSLLWLREFHANSNHQTAMDRINIEA